MNSRIFDASAFSSATPQINHSVKVSSFVLPLKNMFFSGVCDSYFFCIFGSDGLMSFSIKVPFNSNTIWTRDILIKYNKRRFTSQLKRKDIYRIISWYISCEVVHWFVESCFEVLRFAFWPVPSFCNQRPYLNERVQLERSVVGVWLRHRQRAIVATHRSECSHSLEYTPIHLFYSTWVNNFQNKCHVLLDKIWN